MLRSSQPSSPRKKQLSLFIRAGASRAAGLLDWFGLLNKCEHAMQPIRGARAMLGPATGWDAYKMADALEHMGGGMPFKERVALLLKDGRQTSAFLW